MCFGTHFHFVCLVTFSIRKRTKTQEFYRGIINLLCMLSNSIILFFLSSLIALYNCIKFEFQISSFDLFDDTYILNVPSITTLSTPSIQALTLQFTQPLYSLSQPLYSQPLYSLSQPLYSLAYCRSSIQPNQSNPIQPFLFPIK